MRVPIEGPSRTVAGNAMKRVGHLWERLVSFPNLLRAARKARKGKRDRRDVAAFEFSAERELLRIRTELQSGAYQFDPSHTFTITEPKPRLISAAPYRDRVVHHALCNVLEPIYERSFISDGYACRTGKGTHAGVRRCHEFADRFPWVLKCDIRKFFPSIDHDTLKGQLARKIKDRRVLELAGRVIDHSNEQEPVIEWFPGDHLFTYDERGHRLPIGNQTSQFFGNVYLDALDHFLKDRLAVRGYVRYVDDFVLFGALKQELHDWRGSGSRASSKHSGCGYTRTRRWCSRRDRVSGSSVTGCSVHTSGWRGRAWCGSAASGAGGRTRRRTGSTACASARAWVAGWGTRFTRRRTGCGSGCWANVPRRWSRRRRRTDSSCGWRPNRLLRGGSFNNQLVNLRSANRNNNRPGNRNNTNGFRPVSTPPQGRESQSPGAPLCRPERAGCRVQAAIRRRVRSRPNREQPPCGSGRREPTGPAGRRHFRGDHVKPRTAGHPADLRPVEVDERARVPFPARPPR